MELTLGFAGSALHIGLDGKYVHEPEALLATVEPDAGVGVEPGFGVDEGFGVGAVVVEPGVAVTVVTGAAVEPVEPVTGWMGETCSDADAVVGREELPPLHPVASSAQTSAGAGT